jgi:VanZ family protein
MAHWSEYCIFAWLIYYGFRAQQKNAWHWSWAILTLCLVAGYAFLDEIHQLFVPSRTADIRDSLLDTLGGVCGLSLIYFQSLARRRDLSVVVPDGKVIK